MKYFGKGISLSMQLAAAGGLAIIGNASQAAEHPNAIFGTLYHWKDCDAQQVTPASGFLVHQTVPHGSTDRVQHFVTNANGQFAFFGQKPLGEVGGGAYQILSNHRGGYDALAASTLGRAQVFYGPTNPGVIPSLPAIVDNGTHWKVTFASNSPTPGNETGIFVNVNMVNTQPNPSANVCRQNFATFSQSAWGYAGSKIIPGKISPDFYYALYTAGYNFPPYYSPNGFTLYSSTQYTLSFTNPDALRASLPQFGAPQILSANSVNPTGSFGILAGQVIALKLNVDSSAAWITRPGLGALHIQYGPFVGMSVDDFLGLAAEVLGGNIAALGDGAGIPDLVQALEEVNSNFEAGVINHGYLAK